MKYVKSLNGKWHILDSGPFTGYTAIWHRCKCSAWIWGVEISETRPEGKMCKHCERMAKND